MMYVVLRQKKVRFVVDEFKSMGRDHVDVGVITPTALLPLDLRELFGPST